MPLTIFQHFSQDPHILDLGAFINPESKARMAKTYQLLLKPTKNKLKPGAQKAGFKAEHMAALGPILCGSQGLPRLKHKFHEKIICIIRTFLYILQTLWAWFRMGLGWTPQDILAV